MKIFVVTERRQHNIKSGQFVPPPRPAFPKQGTTAQSPPRAIPSLSHERTKRGRTHPSSSKVQLTSNQPEREKKEELTGAHVTEPRESEVGKSEKELWARLDELEREEEEYLAKERGEEQQRAVANEAEKATASSREGLATRTTSDNGVADDESITTKAKHLPQASAEPSTVTAAAPLRITVKHSSSQLLDSTELQEVHRYAGVC